MALSILYSQLFADSLEEILRFYDERNGSDQYSHKLMEKISKKIQLLPTMPEIGRMSDFHGVRMLYIDNYCIDYQIRTDAILVINIYSTLTDPGNKVFLKG